MRKKCDLQGAFDKTISLALKRSRINRNISQNTLSDKTGISRVTLCSWEKGIKTPNSFDLYNLIKELYDTQTEFWEIISQLFEEIADSKRDAIEKEKMEKYMHAQKKRK